MHNHEPEDLEALAASTRVGHETRDLPLPAFGTGMIWFTVLFLVSLVASWVFLWYLPGNHVVSKPTPPAVMPPKPWLQNNATVITDIQELRKGEAQHMTTYAVIDRGKGIVGVPIDVAMDMVARSGLPVQGASTQPAPQEGTQP